MDKFNVSVKDYVFIDFNLSRITFWFKGIPKDTHFTLAFNKNSDYINFHITRHIPANDIKNNPKIEIVRIEKKSIELLEYDIAFIFFNLFFSEIEIKNYESNSFMFISSKDKESDDLSIAFLKKIKPFFSLKQKSRFKLQGDIKVKIKSLLEETELRSFYNNKKK
ncbi:hypothetical protein [Polaribacter sp. Hel1_85]|uniref:hypothetical protein n=1 Tax=Polaribacter sp. Hel1_85 TaxID=1250005 RepID=UPI00052C4B82|nr:hypothetical protein [Polaribacter sp. Hel1_85]KGL62976.1 hypothetical protein PHEL85_2772 [Polaribacter sp. Hel1_85]